MRARPKRRALAGTALLLVASFTIAALAGEAIVRWLRPGFVAGPDPAGNIFWHHDPDLGWFHRPSEKGEFSRPEFAHHVTINSMGFRDRERTPAGPAAPGAVDRSRIAVFGDSFTWGHGVEDDEIFTRLLEPMLGVEVWNLGVSAYSTDQELLLFRRVHDQVRAGVVLVMLSRNDFEGNVTDAYGAYSKPRFVETAGGLELIGAPVSDPTLWRRAASWVRRRSALVNGLAWTIQYSLPGERDDDSGSSPTREAQIRMTLELLDTFARETRDSGARFAVALVPSTAHVYWAPSSGTEGERFEAVKEWGAATNVPVLDLIPAFRDAFAVNGTWLHFRNDKHWTAAGHRLAAETLATLLRERDLVPPGS